MIHACLNRSLTKAFLSGFVVLGTAHPAGASPAEPMEAYCQEPPGASSGQFENISGQPVDAEAAIDFLKGRMEADAIPAMSVAVVSDGNVSFSRAVGIADMEQRIVASSCTIFEGASITKPLFAYFVMTFVEDGSLDLDRPLYEYLPLEELEHDPRHRSLTARMALSHQTGLPNWRSDYPGKELHFQFDPGSGFGYSGEAFQYLARVLQQIAGVDAHGLEKLFQQRVAKPLGMSETAILPDGKLLSRKARGYANGSPVEEWQYGDEFGAAYGVNTTAADFALWLEALINRDGLGETGFETLFARQAQSPADVDPAAAQAFGAASVTLGFFSYDVPGIGQIYTHDGNNEGFSSLFVIHPESRWGMVMLANRDKATQTMLEFALFVNTPQK